MKGRTMRKYCGLIDTSLIDQTIELFGWVDSLKELGYAQFLPRLYMLHWGLW
jgi:aspartyl-tRNA synthetase